MDKSMPHEQRGITHGVSTSVPGESIVEKANGDDTEGSDHLAAILEWLYRVDLHHEGLTAKAMVDHLFGTEDRVSDEWIDGADEAAGMAVLSVTNGYVGRRPSHIVLGAYLQRMRGRRVGGRTMVRTNSGEPVARWTTVMQGRSDVLATDTLSRPEIVCLCGSTRYHEHFQRANYALTMAGKIVLSVGFYPDALDAAHGEHHGCTREQKVKVDELHLRKIDLADSVLVLNVDGYIGSSTIREIAYTLHTKKPVRFLEEQEGADSLVTRKDEIAALVHGFERHPKSP